MSYIPTEKELKKTVKLVEVKVTGTYIARIDERRRTTRKFDVAVLVPEKFDAADVKRLTARALLEDPDLGDFMTMRTHTMTGKPKKTAQTAVLEDMYSERELIWFRKKNAELQKERAAEAAYGKLHGIDGGGSMVDSTEYGDDGLPPVINA